MRTTHFSGTRTAVAAFALTIVGTLSANGQSGTVSLSNRTLRRTNLQVGIGAEVGTSCSTLGCMATAATFTHPIECPVSAGKTCTFVLHLESQVELSYYDDGFFRFLVDGVAPVPTDQTNEGYVDFDDDDANSPNPSTRSYAVVAKVKNTTKNQLHTIEVDISCFDSTHYGATGCWATMLFRTLSTSVYTP